MIVCSCTRITSSDIRRAVEWMRAADPDVVLTPGKVYRTLGKKPVCGGCLNHFVLHVYGTEEGPLPAELRNLRGSTRGGRLDERRPEGNRLSERGAPQRADSG